MYLTAQNAQMEAYQTAYVENGVSAGEASTTVGNYVRRILNEKYGTDGKFKTGLATITATATGNIEISTTDFVIEGEIADKGGNLTWGEIEENKPRIVGVPTHLELDSDQLPYTIHASLKGTTETSITWSNGGSTVVTVSNGQLSLATDITGSSVTATITASADGCETKTCEVTITKVATPQVGDYYKYGVGYADMGDTSKTYTAYDGEGWRVLKVTKNGNAYDIDLISTGCPAKLKYNNESNNVWFEATNAEGTGNAYYAAAGLMNRFLDIPLTAGVTSAPSNNTGFYTSISIANEDKHANWNDTTGAVFLTKQASRVRNLSLLDLNTAEGHPEAGNTGSSSKNYPPSSYDVRGLFNIGYTYFLASAYDNNSLQVIEKGKFEYGYNFSARLRPVVTITSVKPKLVDGKADVWQ